MLPLTSEKFAMTCPTSNARFENRTSAVHFELIVYYDYLDNVVDRMSATGMSVSSSQ